MWEERQRLVDEIRCGDPPDAAPPLPCGPYPQPGRPPLLHCRGLREAEEDEREDAEIREMSREDRLSGERAVAQLEHEMALSLLPDDPDAGVSGVVMEIKGAVGGEEACVFAGELLEMYRAHSRARGWRFDVVSLQKSEQGHCKHAEVSVSGEGVFRELRHEAGVHRVQRVPATIKADKIQTSAAAVLVLPEAEGADAVALDPKDLEVTTMRASGAGGQHVNTTESAVRVTHLPSGISVRIQDERSQHQNRDKALRVIRARLLDAERQRQREERGSEAASQLAGGDRSAKIRTYNFKESRVTDHRVGLTLYKLDEVLAGSALGEVLGALVEDHQRQRIERFQRAQAAGGGKG